jgi:hypothetical protein
MSKFLRPAEGKTPCFLFSVLAHNNIACRQASLVAKYKVKFNFRVSVMLKA